MNRLGRFRHCMLGQLLGVLLGGFCSLENVPAADYFITIGGGYEPEGNQASLEANVLFFQKILSAKHRGPFRHDVYFADGQDMTADLQVLLEKPAKPALPASDLLAAIYRRQDEVDVTYRNHLVTNIAGALDPAQIRSNLELLSKSATTGDRIVIYVTAHGSEGPEGDRYNTTIDCWDERKITAREFTEWLNKISPTVPVVMVMAQCYCGGFAHTIFQDLEKSKGLAPHLRAGFFAQQHSLPAAGCRPDIEHDEEFSSYFWGALVGRSRNGVPIQGCDIDGNGVISFAEAYAYAVIAGETIDIPLRTSEVLLRTYSRLNSPEDKDSNRDPKLSRDIDTRMPQSTDPVRQTAPTFSTLSGTLQSLVDRTSPVSARIIQQLSKSLEFSLQDDVSLVIKGAAEHQRANRFSERNRRRSGSGRRDLLNEVAQKWPELGDARNWEKSPLLRSDNQEKLLSELQQLPSWKVYEERLKQRRVASKAAEMHELRSVKFRRLIHALEVSVLERNLVLVASPDVVTRYQKMIELEESSLISTPPRTAN